MDSDVPHNQAGRTDTEAGATVLPFRGAWFGSSDELVPFGPRARVEKNAAAGRDDPEAAGSEPVGAQEPAAAAPKRPPHVVADDFWAGLADAGDLVQFPAASRGPTASVVSPRSSLSLRRCHVSLAVAVAVAVLGIVVIGLRLSNGTGSGTLAPAAALARRALSIANAPGDATGVDQQQMRPVPLRLRLPVRAHRPRPHVTRHPARRISRRILVSQSRSSSAHSQPAVYSTPAPPQTPSAPASGSGTTGSSSGSGGGGGGGGSGAGGGGSGGGGSHGGGSHRSGPSGRAAAFGPGKMGG